MQLMTPEELRLNLHMLVEQYVSGASQRAALLAQIDAAGTQADGVKGVLARLDPWLGQGLAAEHALLIKDIYFCFC